VFVFPHRDRATVTNPALDTGLRRIDEFPAPASPGHVSAVARTPHRTHRPTILAVVVPVWAAGRRNHNPAAAGAHEVADVVVREIVMPRFGHREVVPRTTDRLSANLIQPCIAGLANGLRCLYVSAQVAAVQMSDVGLSFVDVSP
jgi:hypothetical protein